MGVFWQAWIRASWDRDSHLAHDSDSPTKFESKYELVWKVISWPDFPTRSLSKRSEFSSVNVFNNTFLRDWSYLPVFLHPAELSKWDVSRGWLAQISMCYIKPSARRKRAHPEIASKAQTYRFPEACAVHLAHLPFIFRTVQTQAFHYSFSRCLISPLSRSLDRLSWREAKHCTSKLWPWVT